MKAQRRHELKENDLAHALLVARDYLVQRGARLGLGLIVIIVVVGAVGLGLRSRTVAEEDLWRRKNELSFDKPETGRQSLEALATMTRDCKDRRFILSSLIDQGQQALRLAQEVPFPPDREFNNLAKSAFEELLVRFKDNPLAVGLAQSGLATVAENAFALDGNPAHKQEAEKHLTSVIDNPALNGLPLQRLALDRRKALDVTFTAVKFDEGPPREGQQAVQQDLSTLPIKIEGLEDLEGVEFEVVNQADLEAESANVAPPPETPKP